MKTRAFLNAVSTGVLIFLLVEMGGHLLEGIEELVTDAVERGTTLAPALRAGGRFAYFTAKAGTRGDQPGDQILKFGSTAAADKAAK